jgi:pimeloyl-ACP methyl ester carboxylesterase
MNRIASALVAIVALATTQVPANAEQHGARMADRSVAVRAGHLPVNGLDYYYEVHGSGEPLLLLHGGLGTLDMFGPVLPAIAAGREVILVDMHGHGRTQLGDRPISLVAMGDDMAVLLQELGYDQVDAMGYSMGGGVALRLAIQHPEIVRRLVVMSAGFAQDGFFPEMLPMQAAVGADMAGMMQETPMYRSYVAVAPDPSEFAELLDRMGALMRQSYDWRNEVKALSMPVMLVYGDADMIRPEHVVEFYQLLGGGLRDAGWMREHMSQNRLAIIPNRTHYDVFLAPELAATIRPFLDGDTSVKSWDELVREQN